MTPREQHYSDDEYRRAVRKLCEDTTARGVLAETVAEELGVSIVTARIRLKDLAEDDAEPIARRHSLSDPVAFVYFPA